MTRTGSRAVPLLLYLVGAGIALLLLRFVQYSPFGHDEVEHAHVAWRLLQGERPYADFHQNHMPAVWWVGALALRVLPHSLSGGLLAVAASFSPTMWPLLALLPLRIGYEAWHAGEARTLLRLASYGLGGVTGALPLVGWLMSQGLWTSFLADVIVFNGAYPKPPARALEFLEHPLLVGALFGAAVMAWRAWTRNVARGWPYVAVAGSVALGFSAIAFTAHATVYNQQAATIPAGLAFAVAGAAIAGP